MQTREEQLAAELDRYIEKYANEMAELRRRLIDLEALIRTPLSDEQPDVAAFGRGAWVYCRAHLKPHLTGWCGVGAGDKIGLGVATADEAYAKCRAWGLKIFNEG